MAVCKICGGEMLEHVGCKVETCICKGKSMCVSNLATRKTWKHIMMMVIYVRIVLLHLGTSTIML